MRLQGVGWIDLSTGALLPQVPLVHQRVVLRVRLQCARQHVSLRPSSTPSNLHCCLLQAQAQDRIHRLGQYKPITVVRFVIGGTIEERILKLQVGREGKGGWGSWYSRWGAYQASQWYCLG